VSAEPLHVLIVDGQNNHAVWPKSTIMMKQYLEETGIFEVDIARTKYTWRGEKREGEWLKLAGIEGTEDLPEPKLDPDFKPDFNAYDVVISNFGVKAARWPAETEDAFEAYVKSGGGFVSVHAADNCFADWKAYNRIIGLGGWGGRKGNMPGAYVYYNDAGELIRDEKPGKKVGGHGAREPFPITVRVADHPITKGMPEVWMKSPDECYANLRGPAEQLTVLSTGKDLSKQAASNKHEPMLMVIEYGKGRCFHTTLGHDVPGLEGVGFITSFVRGTEWAATGRVTLPIPDDFPTADKVSTRTFELVE
ncbi:MAG: ThuA domain-containing protein, partial [Opitutales bacterium]